MKLLPIIFTGLCSLSSVYAMHFNKDHEKARKTAELLTNVYKMPQFQNYKNDLAGLNLQELGTEETKYKEYLATLNKLPLEQQTEGFKQVIQKTYNVLSAINNAQFYFMLPFMKANYQDNFYRMTLEQLVTEEKTLTTEREKFAKSPEKSMDIIKQIDVHIAAIQQIRYARQMPFLQENYQNDLSRMTLGQLQLEEGILKIEKEKLAKLPEDQQNIIQTIDILLAEIQRIKSTKKTFLQRHSQFILTVSVLGAALLISYGIYTLLNSENNDTEKQFPEEVGHINKASSIDA